MRRADGMVGHEGEETAESSQPVAAGSPAAPGAGSILDSLALPPPPGSLKVAVHASPPTASPTKVSNVTSENMQEEVTPYRQERRP